MANILRDQQAEKRDHHRVSSLNVMINVANEGLIELAGTIGQRELNDRRCRHPRNDDDLAQLAHDMADVIAKLPDELRDLANRLKTQTVSAIARDMGIPRTTLTDRLRSIRKRFEKAGLKDYV